MPGHKNQTQTQTQTTTSAASQQAPKQEEAPKKQDNVRHSNGSIAVGQELNDASKFADGDSGIRDGDEKKSGGGMFSGMLDTIMGAISPKNTSLDSMPPELLEMIEPGTMLRFAFGPTDMDALALGDEQKALEAVANVLTVNNPSPALMEFLIDSEKFTDLIWSGHGSEDNLFVTGRDGKADKFSNQSIVEMLDGSSISEVFLAVCDGGDKLDTALNDVGIDTYAYDRKVGDDEAIGDIEEYGATGGLDNVKPTEIELPEMNIMGMHIPAMTIQAGGQHQKGKRRAAQAMAAMGMDLSGMDFSGLDLSGMDFSGLGNIGAMDFSGLDLGLGGMGPVAPSTNAAAGAKAPATTTPTTGPKTPAPSSGGAGGRAAEAYEGPHDFNAGGYDDLGRTGYGYTGGFGGGLGAMY